jgi:hypothetical protein
MNDSEEWLSRMSRLVTANTKTASILGARSMVLGKFLDAALPLLTNSQRGEISQSFRQVIEDSASITDDMPLPADYHSAMFELTNAILSALGQGPAR